MSPSNIIMIILLALACILNPTQCITITKTAIIDENNLQNNGASITTYAGSYNCQSSTCWAIYADDDGNRGFNLKLSLNASFNFHASYISTLTMQVYYNTNTNWNSGRDLVVVFNQATTNKYFANKMVLDMSSDHGIFPRWSSVAHTPNLSFQDYATGDPELLTSQYSSQSRFRKLNGGTYWIYSPSRVSNERHVESPLTFILENHPSSHMVYSYTNPGETIRSCGFPSMSTDVELNIFVAANSKSYYDSLNIESIKVMMEYEIPTASPTKVPTQHPITTLQPTVGPTDIPTETPTFSPSDIPSKSPTDIPSDQPTFDPTDIPTDTPSKSPTHIPSDQPTLQPTPHPTGKSLIADESIKPTISVENSHSIIPTWSQTKAVILAMDDQYDEPIANVFELDGTKIIIIITAVLICACCVLCLLRYKVCKKKHRMKQKKYVISTTQPNHKNKNKNNKISIASHSQSTTVAMSRLSANPSLNSVKLRTTSTLINQYVKSQEDMIGIESRSNADLCVITAGNIDEDTGDSGDTGDDTGDTGDIGTGTGTGTDEDVTQTQSTLIDDKAIISTPFGDMMEMDDEKYNHMFDRINRRYKQSVQSNNSFSERNSNNISNANNHFLPIMPFQNSLKSVSSKSAKAIPHHRRIFSEGPKENPKKKTIDGGNELDVKEDEFVVIGEDESNSDADMTPSDVQEEPLQNEQQTAGK